MTDCSGNFFPLAKPEKKIYYLKGIELGSLFQMKLTQQRNAMGWLKKNCIFWKRTKSKAANTTMLTVILFCKKDYFFHYYFFQFLLTLYPIYNLDLHSEQHKGTADTVLLLQLHLVLAPSQKSTRTRPFKGSVHVISSGLPFIKWFTMVLFGGFIWVTIRKRCKGYFC